ncbi:Sjogren's syndrome/scleroderma autoantigen 1 family protein [Halorubrum sp. HHNYT27]|uniref:Sjogren's syndrome/scleroderma autoantigen 1 family protein n=1 Tax=Halorubrum sp. HHNYT27 TaxID=3402275 RepID=UPI003EBDDE21
MSDGFDKEAEREKLREKLSDDDEKREHTQRMSELLLKGATMTNRHCDDCGDPIFRQDGQEFCPSCHTVDAADVQDGGEADRGVEASETPETHETPETPETSRPPETEADGDSPTPPRGNGTAAPDESTESTGPVARGSAPPTGASGERSPPSTGTPAANASPAATAGSGSIADARASLTRSLNRFAVAAEETDDPRRARDHLEAAREAAEALAALDR